ncbi:expressed unknown protein [Seminavis robusta]|uniref:Uncharacterized protein n=1 Tax=Seminavis robusta TaxID=568900 RepID=A0A9N8HWM8_9STRA|nr:expressed unknown protein [Seminavis robusta]|eukprot:Sro2005_g310520.1 n/a (103) ;mRNA; r:14835-15143
MASFETSIAALMGGLPSSELSQLDIDFVDKTEMSCGDSEKKAQDALAQDALAHEVATLSLGASSTPVKEIEGAPVALKALAHWILNDCKKIVVLSGAGVSPA